MDRMPRQIDPDSLRALEHLARQVELELEAHRRLRLLEEGLLVQRREQRGKELLAAMVVHDLRNPSTAITLIATYLAEQHPAMEELREILDESDRMHRMLADVLDVCLAEVHLLRPRRRHFALPAMVHQVARRFARMSAARGQWFEVDVPEDKDVIVDADPNLVDRTITNLVQNALKHGPARQPIEIRVVSRTGHARVEVADKGQPIDQKSRDSIFRPFEHLGEASTGYGLGLAFCDIAVAAHGGTIGVTAEEHGNCFWFELPMG
jgi:signal transduction histidine kinase